MAAGEQPGGALLVGKQIPSRSAGFLIILYHFISQVSNLAALCSSVTEQPAAFAAGAMRQVCIARACLYVCVRAQASKPQLRCNRA